MGKDDDDKCLFPLTSLQIGDLQSYLSVLNLFLALESNKLYILVDNQPWLQDLGPAPAHLWQLMVTKSRLSPFANSKARRGRKEGKEGSLESSPSKSKKLVKWFSLIDAATLSHKRSLPPVKNLHQSLLLTRELQRTLHGFIVFEITWNDVRGINYLNELQTDTSLALEAKVMQRWEFDGIAQASKCLSSWFSGTPSEYVCLKESLGSLIGDVFYDADENLSRTYCNNDNEITHSSDLSVENNSSCCSDSSSRLHSGTSVDLTSEPHTPPPTGPYKRRRVIRSIGTGGEVDFYSEEMQGGRENSLHNSEACTNDLENGIETKQYQDVLILFRFNDRDLPFKLREIIMSDLRLLTLLEAGLPSWVIFLQSYPGFCHLYRPWMCPLARALYVLISIITVLIGFYDLYKNVPVLKATASRVCGPLFDWIETWEMVSRIKYLGTMLFLHNFQKAVTWFLAVTRTTRSFFSVFAQPLLEPLAEILGLLLPMWNMIVGVVESLYTGIWVLVDSSFSAVVDLIEIILWPIWLIISLIWSIATKVIYPIFWLLSEILYAPIRLVLAFSSSLVLIWAWMVELIVDIWQSVSSIVQVTSASKATVSPYEVSMWRSLWNDLFSQVFRALRSILNGFVAFFTACNRHRLSIYNHMREFIRRILGQAPQSQCLDYKIRSPSSRNQSPKSRNRSPTFGNQSPAEVNKRDTVSPEKSYSTRLTKQKSTNPQLVF